MSWDSIGRNSHENAASLEASRRQRSATAMLRMSLGSVSSLTWFLRHLWLLPPLQLQPTMVLPGAPQQEHFVLGGTDGPGGSPGVPGTTVAPAGTK